MVHEFSIQNFKDEVIENNGLVLVDLYATWCGPCKMLAPIVETIADEYTEVKVGKVDIDQNLDLATEYGVRSVPTLLIFKDGELLNKSVGLQSKNQILELLNIG
ncbi:MAG: thioredoxin [Anaerocolumna sp.]|jgi:thioredoxin 1|nr:thioredoxin [Anaerocolumna sp.]